jgi:hypothetical protein
MNIPDIFIEHPYYVAAFLFFLVTGGIAVARRFRSSLEVRRDRTYSVSPAPAQLSNIRDEALASLDPKVRPTTVSPLQEQITPQASGSAGVPPPAPKRPPSGEIFLSHASEDDEKAQMLAEALERMGLSVWWDSKIPPGASYRAVIKEKLASSKCVIVLWSRASVEKDWVIDEAEVGNDREILVPARIENVDLPVGLRGIQAADLTDWKGSSSHAGFKNLVTSVKSLLESGNTSAKSKRSN